MAQRGRGLLAAGGWARASQEDVEAGSDEVYDRGSGGGEWARSVADGGQRAGSAYVFSQAGVREFRVQGQASAAAYGSALYGHGVGGVVTTVSRSGGTSLHGMAFYTARDSAWAAANPFSVASTYADGVVTSALVKPKDLRQQFGGSVGGPVAWKDDHGSDTDQSADTETVFLLCVRWAAAEFSGDLVAGLCGVLSLTAMQTALLANRGVTPAKTNAALNYLDSLTGTVARKADQTVNFGRLDWQRTGGSRVVLEYNRARWSGPGAARSGAVVDRGVASIGIELWQSGRGRGAVGAVAARRAEQRGAGAGMGASCSTRRRRRRWRRSRTSGRVGCRRRCRSGRRGWCSGRRRRWGRRRIRTSGALRLRMCWRGCMGGSSCRWAGTSAR